MQKISAWHPTDVCLRLHISKTGAILFLLHDLVTRQTSCAIGWLLRLTTSPPPVKLGQFRGGDAIPPEIYTGASG
jgi:hypothetical protein